MPQVFKQSLLDSVWRPVLVSLLLFPMCAFPEQAWEQQLSKKFFRVFSFFADRFLAGQWGICFFCLFAHNVHIFQVTWSTFIKNPLCYLSISESNQPNNLLLLLTLSTIYKVVGKYFRNVGIFSWLVFSVKCVPEGCPTLAPPPACYEGVEKSQAMGRHCFV